MTGGNETISAVRVVVCSREASLARQVSDQLGVSARCRQAATPYEAAADALTGQADLVVIDAAALTGPHAALPGLLARHGLLVLTVGVADTATDIAAAIAELLARPSDAPAPEAPHRPAPATGGLVSPEELAALLEEQP